MLIPINIQKAFQNLLSKKGYFSTHIPVIYFILYICSFLFHFSKAFKIFEIIDRFPFWIKIRSTLERYLKRVNKSPGKTKVWLNSGGTKLAFYEKLDFLSGEVACVSLKDFREHLKIILWMSHRVLPNFFLIYELPLTNLMSETEINFRNL